MLLKRKSPTKFLEDKHPYPENEYAYIKTPGKLVDITAGLRDTHDVIPDLKRVYSMVHSGQFPRGYTSVHNHSSQFDFSNTLPSARDLGTLFSLLYHRGMIIAQHSLKSGEIEGYYFVKKSKKTPKFPTLSEAESLHINKLLHQAFENRNETKNPKKETADRFLKKYYRKHVHALKDLESDLTSYAHSNPSLHLDEDPDQEEKHFRALETFCGKYNLLLRIVPTRGFKFDRHTAKFVAETGLESKLRVLTLIAAFILIITSFTSSITGFIIATIPQNTHNLLSIIFLILGIVIISHVMHIRYITGN